MNANKRRSALICVHPRLEYFFKTTKIEQKIDTGGINNTSTPILKLRMNRELTLVSDARHIEHCASAKPCASSITAAAHKTKTNTRRQVQFMTTPQAAPARQAVAP